MFLKKVSCWICTALIIICSFIPFFVLSALAYGIVVSVVPISALNDDSLFSLLCLSFSSGLAIYSGVKFKTVYEQKHGIPAKNHRAIGKSFIGKLCVFVLIFTLYHILFSRFFETDENNNIIAPGWYYIVGLALSVGAAWGKKLSYILNFLKAKSYKDLSRTDIRNVKIPRSKKKQSELATKELNTAKYAAGLANKSDSLTMFFSSFDLATESLATLTRFDKVKFDPPPKENLERLQHEEQVHICDAIIRAKESTTEEIKGKYRNSREFQEKAVKNFENQISFYRHRFSEGTAELADSSIAELKRLIGVSINAQPENSMIEAIHRYGGVDAELMTIDMMDGHDFEYWCADALQNSGFTNVEVTPGSGDQGVDVLAQKDGIKYAVQCKRYNSDLGNTPVQEVHSGKTFYHCHVGAVLTNRYFTDGAKQLAQETGTLLWDREWIKNYLKTKSTSPVQVPETPGLFSDELLVPAVDVVLETGQASVSMIERRLKLGYAQAARIMDEMEELGIVGPFVGSKPRTILITKEQWEVFKNR